MPHIISNLRRKITIFLCRIYKKPVLYLRREFDEFLQRWRAREDRLPLVLKGARQVGKTETVRHFAETAYANFVEINFVERPEFKEIIRDGFSVDALTRNISMIDPRLRFAPGNTLLFFDELQEFPEIATSLKFFAQDGRFDVICSGSLLGIQVRRVASYSVGHQETETMHSLDFEEFLWGCGYLDGQISGLLEPVFARRPFAEAIKNTMDRLFMDYCVTGGMPDVLETYFTRRTCAYAVILAHGKGAFSRTSSAKPWSRPVCRLPISSGTTRPLRWISSRGRRTALSRLRSRPGTIVPRVCVRSSTARSTRTSAGGSSWRMAMSALRTAS